MINYDAAVADLPAFQVVPPRSDLKLDDFRLSDGTKMTGPDGLLIPAGRSFSMIVNAATRVYSYRFDEAMRDNQVAARSMRRDAFIEGLLEERWLPTINRRWQLEVDDDHDPAQKLVREALTRVVEGVTCLDQFKRANLEACWYGRAGCQWAFARTSKVNNLWGLSRWDPVHGDSLQFTFDGVPAVLLDSQAVSWYAAHGATTGPDGDLRPTDRGGTALVLSRPEWRDRFSVHTHILRKADFFEGELAGSVQGFGLRGQLYWQYVVRTEALSWMLAYMQAVGQMDLLVFNYPAGNAAARAAQEANAAKIIGKAAIVCPRNPQGNWAAVEQVSMNEAGLRAMHQLVADYFDRHIERLIVGQSMSSGADHGSGLGGTGRAEFTKACVPVEGSEILTRGGFKSPHDVQVGDDVLAYDVETDQCRWTPLLKKSFYEDCEVDRFFLAQNRFETVCTPDHSWAVERTEFVDPGRPFDEATMERGPRGAARYKNPIRYLQKADKIGSRQNIILAATERETEDSLLSPVEAAILGWVITDGGIKWSDRKFKGRRCRAYICQSKEEYIPVIRELVTSFQGKTTETVFHTKSRTFPMSGNTSVTKPQYSWDIPHDRATAFFEKCGFRDRSDLPGIVTQLSQPARAAMLEAMMMGDGSSGSFMQRQWPKSKSPGSFYNTDQHVMEAFEILCVLEGRATGQLEVKKKDPRYKQAYSKHVKSNRYVYGSYLQRESAGRADVWCPTTKYGTWVMRQNGRVMVTGNTKDEILIHDTNRLDETLTRDLVGPLLRYNFPWAKFPVRYASTLPDLDKAAKVSSGATMIQMGIPIKVDEFREAGGFTRPEPGDEVIGGMMPQMPPGGGMGGPPGGMTPPGMGAGGPGGPPPGAGAPGQLPGGTPLGPGGLAGPGGGGPPVMSSMTGPAGAPNVVFGHPGHPSHARAGGPVRHESGGAPAAGLAMGYPGGGNTYVPRFGGGRGSRFGFNKAVAFDKYGFTRYARPGPLVYGLGDQRAFEAALAHNPREGTTHGAFADWLEENGDPVRAARHRLAAVWPQLLAPLLEAKRGGPLRDEWKAYQDLAAALDQYGDAPVGAWRTSRPAHAHTASQLAELLRREAAKEWAETQAAGGVRRNSGIFVTTARLDGREQAVGLGLEAHGVYSNPGNLEADGTTPAPAVPPSDLPPRDPHLPTAPPPIPAARYARHGLRAPAGGVAHANRLFRGGRFAPRAAYEEAPESDDPSPAPPAAPTDADTRFRPAPPPDAPTAPQTATAQPLPAVPGRELYRPAPAYAPPADSGGYWDDTPPPGANVDRQAVRLWNEYGLTHPLDDVGGLVGAPPGSQVRVRGDYDGIDVTVDHPAMKYPAERRVARDQDGEVYIENVGMSFKPEFQSQGIAADMFAAQVAAAAKAGVSYITCWAAKGGNYTGYAVWPKFGYDQHIHDFPQDQRQVLNATFPDAETVLDIIASPEGRRWWCGYRDSGGYWIPGNGFAMQNAVFDLSPGSRSMAVLHAYLAEKGKNPTSPAGKGESTGYSSDMTPITYNDQQAFERAIDENPFEAITHGAYADWLDENGQPGEAAFRRSMADWIGRTRGHMRGESTTHPIQVLQHLLPAGVDPAAESLQHDRGGEGYAAWRRGGGSPVRPYHTNALSVGRPGTPPPRVYAWPEYRHMEEAFRRAFVPTTPFGG